MIYINLQNFETWTDDIFAHARTSLYFSWIHTKQILNLLQKFSIHELTIFILCELKKRTKIHTELTIVYTLKKKEFLLCELMIQYKNIWILSSGFFMAGSTRMTREKNKNRDLVAKITIITSGSLCGLPPVCIPRKWACC